MMSRSSVKRGVGIVVPRWMRWAGICLVLALVAWYFEPISRSVLAFLDLTDGGSGLT